MEDREEKKSLCSCLSNLKRVKSEKITPTYLNSFLGSSKEEMSTHIYYLSFLCNEQITMEPLTDFKIRLFIVAEL